MQTCPECGARTERGELFCGSCGAYLEWEEATVPDGGGAVAVDAEVGGGSAGGGPDRDGTVAEPAAGGGPDVGSRAAVTGDGATSAGGEEAEGGGEPSLGGTGVADDVGGLARAARGGRAGGRDAPAATAAAQVPDEHDAPVDGPVPEPATGPGRAERVASAAGAGGLGGRATRVVRQAADQATGGAASNAPGAATRARSRARGATRAPGRSAAEDLTRAAGVPPAAARGAAAATAATGRAATEPEVTGSRPARPAPARPTTPGPTRPAAAPPRQPEARKPGAPAPRRPVPTEVQDEPPPKPGELICGACGVGNAPHRNFCRRCGASLADAPVQQQRSWWRRLLRPDPKPGPAAGTRPGYRRRRRFPTGLLLTVVVLGLLGGAAWYFRDTLAGWYDTAVDRVAGDDRVIPDAAVATSERPDRPDDYAADGVFEQSWSPQGDGVGESVTFEFSEPFRVVYVLVRGGNGLGEELRLQEARPARLRVTYTSSTGETTAEEVRLVDDGQPQRLDVGVSDVSAVTLTILEVHGKELEAPVALAEVEFFGRR